MPGHPARTLAGQPPHTRRTSPVPACAGAVRRASGLVSPAAWGDVPGPRRLRVLDLTPSKSNRTRSGTLRLCSVSKKAAGEGWCRHGGGGPAPPPPPPGPLTQASAPTVVALVVAPAGDVGARTPRARRCEERRSRDTPVQPTGPLA
jgi:hypothetical protein